MTEAKHTPVQFGMTVGADFEASTMTLEMEPGYVVAVGPVAVLPRGTYDELLEAVRAVMGYPEIRGYIGSILSAQADEAIAKATGA
jgi:hypothetical protein